MHRISNKGGVLYWLLLGALGVFLILGRQMAKNIVFSILGAGLVITAVPGVISWWHSRSQAPDGAMRLLGSLVVLLIGLWILFKPRAFDSLLNKAIGLVLIVSGVQWFLRGRRAGRDVPVMALGAVAVIVGLIIACNNAATTWVVVAEGIALVYTAVAGLISERRFD